MLTLFYAPGACSMASHIVLEESGEKYEPRRMDLSKGEQRTTEYMKIHPLGRVPALKLDDGSPLTENTAILPFLGKRFGLWPTDSLKEARALSIVGFFASSVHPAHAHIGRPERYTEDKSAFPGIQAMGKKSFHDYLKQIDAMYVGRERSEEHTSELQSLAYLVCRLLLEKKKKGARCNRKCNEDKTQDARRPRSPSPRAVIVLQTSPTAPYATATTG